MSTSPNHVPMGSKLPFAGMLGTKRRRMRSVSGEKKTPDGAVTSSKGTGTKAADGAVTPSKGTSKKAAAKSFKHEKEVSSDPTKPQNQSIPIFLKSEWCKKDHGCMCAPDPSVGSGRQYISHFGLIL